jgi:hypothetical protein
VHRTSLFILLGALAGGCSNATVVADMAVPDRATAPDLAAGPDLVAVPDLVAAPDLVEVPDLGPRGCAGIYACIQACPVAQLNTCVPACVNAGSATAQGYFAPLQSCAASACYAPVDAGAPPCAVPASGVCLACVNAHCLPQLTTCLAH